MKVAIEVSTLREGDAMRLALDDPEIRALVVMKGVLLSLPNEQVQLRVLRVLVDGLPEGPAAAPLVPRSFIDREGA